MATHRFFESWTGKKERIVNIAALLLLIALVGLFIYEALFMPKKKTQPRSKTKTYQVDYSQNYSLAEDTEEDETYYDDDRDRALDEAHEGIGRYD